MSKYTYRTVTNGKGDRIRLRCDKHIIKVEGEDPIVHVRETPIRINGKPWLHSIIGHDEYNNKVNITVGFRQKPYREQLKRK